MGPPHTDWHLRKPKPKSTPLHLRCPGPGMKAGEPRQGGFPCQSWTLQVALSQLPYLPPIFLVLYSDTCLGQPSFQSLPFLLIFSLNYYILCIVIALPLVMSNGYLHSFIFVYFIIVLISNTFVLSLVTYLINSVLFFYFTRLQIWNLSKAMKYSPSQLCLFLIGWCPSYSVFPGL